MEYRLGSLYQSYWPELIFIFFPLSKGALKNIIDRMLPVRWLGLVTLTETGNQLWSIPVEIMYYAIIPFICLTFKLASRNSATKTVFLSALALLCYMGCNYNLTQVTGREYGRARFVWILTAFKLTFFVFLTGSLVGFLLHSIRASQVLSAILKRNLVQAAISLLSVIQFVRAYNASRYPVGEIYMTYIHIPGFQWAIFLFLLLLNNSAKWNPFVAWLESSANLQHFGKYSFGTYLNHYVVIYPITLTEVGRVFAQRVGFSETIVVIVCCVYWVGWAWYVVLEKRMIVLANKICQRLVDASNKNKDMLPREKPLLFI